MDATPEETNMNNAEKLLPEPSNDDNAPAPPQQDASKKPKKEDRTVDQFMKSLNSVPSLEEKLSLVCKKYVQSEKENKRLNFYMKQSDKHHLLVMKEKEHLQLEFNKTILMKSKLENLCRELQKQNKAIKEESLLKIREEEERRKVSQTKFQNSITEITTLLQQNNEKNTKLRDDNISMTEKLKSVLQQCQVREQQVDKMSKQMELESELSDAKLQQASLQHQAEKQHLLAEMEHIKMTFAQYRAKIMELQGTETALRGQLAVYTDKYDEFQNALTKSNQVFGGFKEQVESMSKKIKKLEKESAFWKKRWETSQCALLDMCGERQASEEKATTSGRLLQHMQSLCRTLQAERTVLLNCLKENNIERPPLQVPPPVAPAPPPTPTPAPESDTKVDAMVANCAQLRQSLAHLQSQLNVLTTKNGSKEEPAKLEKQKKSKSKKSKAEKQVQKTEAGGSSDSNERESSVAKEDASDKKPSAFINEVQKEINDSAALAPNEINANPSGEPNEIIAKASGATHEIIANASGKPNETNDDNGTEVLHEIDIECKGKIDEETMESLLQAINVANMNLSDLEVVNSEDIEKMEINDIDFSIEPLNEDTGEVPLVAANLNKSITEVETKITSDSSNIVEISLNDEDSHNMRVDL